MLQFVHFESIAKKMSNCDFNSVFRKNVLIAAQQFLHRHMFTLQMLPKLETVLNAGIRQPSFEMLNDKDLSQEREEMKEPIIANQEALEVKLNALLEQYAQLKDFLRNAIEAGHAEEAALLQRAIGECKEEIRKVRRIHPGP